MKYFYQHKLYYREDSVFNKPQFYCEYYKELDDPEITILDPIYKSGTFSIMFISDKSELSDNEKIEMATKLAAFAKEEMSKHDDDWMIYFDVDEVFSPLLNSEKDYYSILEELVDHYRQSDGVLEHIFKNKFNYDMLDELDIVYNLCYLLGRKNFNSCMECYEDFYGFHKQFRQVDVFEDYFKIERVNKRRVLSRSISGKLDSIMWNVISMSKHLYYIWKYIKETKEGIKINDENE